MSIRQNTTIKTKLTAIMMLTCLIALTLAGVAFVLWGQASFRDVMAYNLTTQAAMIADNCKAALSFADAADANETLSALRTEPSIVYGGIYTSQKVHFASYCRDGVDTHLRPFRVEEQGHSFSDCLLTVFHSILLDGETIGYVCLRSDLQFLHATLRRNVSIVTIVLLLALLIAYLASARLQGIISHPILRLARVAQTVSKDRLYSVRAPKQSNDEVGLLIDSFNEMLEQIQQRDAQLVDMNENLEETVKARTLALSASNDRLSVSNQRLQVEVSERKRAEADLRQAKNRAEHMSAELAKTAELAREMAAQAEWANAAKSEFLANMSHEIRTPLNAVVGFSDLLAGQHLSPDQHRDVSIIREAARNLLNLINDILDFSKIEAGQLSTHMTDCSLGKLLNSLEALMTPQALEKTLEFKVIEDEDLPACVRSDPQRLQQCLINLVSNALKFTEEGHVHLRVSLHEDAGQQHIHFEVEDTGIGIPQECHAAVFESFTQADGSTTRKYGGTGLGLTVTRQLAELLGGKLTLTSEAGQGSVFSLVIPVGMDAAGQPRLDRQSMSDSAPEETGQMEWLKLSGSVLLAEDIRTNQILMETILAKMGLVVTLAEDGHQALTEAQTQPFDLILMDMQMPKMNGYEATRRIRERESCDFGFEIADCGLTEEKSKIQNPKSGIKRVPIVALTANAMKGDAEKCLAAGCDDYLAKPIDAQDLMRVAAKYLLPGKGSPSQTADAADVPMSASPASVRSTSQPSSGDDQLNAIINWGPLVERLGDEDIIREIMPTYMEDTSTHFERLSRAVEAGDCAGIAYHAHALKGVGRNLSIDRLSDVAFQLERAGKDDDMEACMLHFDELSKETEKVLSALSQSDWIEKAKQGAGKG